MFAAKLKSQIGSEYFQIPVERSSYQPRAEQSTVSRASTDSRAPGPPPKKKMRFGLIQDFQPNFFYDLLVEVVKIYPANYGVCEMYVTDYTSHRDLFDYPSPEETDDFGRDGDSFGYMPTTNKQWPGPWGQTVLHIEVHEPHASHARNVREGDFVHLQNVRCKMSSSGKMEANMWPDRQMHPNKTCVAVIQPHKTSDGQNLLERKEQYWKLRERLTSGAQSKREEGPSRAAAKRQKKKAKEQAKAQQDRPGGELNEKNNATVNKHGKLRDLRYGMCTDSCSWVYQHCCRPEHFTRYPVNGPDVHRSFTTGTRSTLHQPEQKGKSASHRLFSLSPRGVYPRWSSLAGRKRGL